MLSFGRIRAHRIEVCKHVGVFIRECVGQVNCVLVMWKADCEMESFELVRIDRPSAQVVGEVQNVSS